MVVDFSILIFDKLLPFTPPTIHGGSEGPHREEEEEEVKEEEGEGEEQR